MAMGCVGYGVLLAALCTFGSDVQELVKEASRVEPLTSGRENATKHVQNDGSQWVLDVPKVPHTEALTP